MPTGSGSLWEVTNPYNVDIGSPLIYQISITSQHREYRYVGKSSSPGRLLKAYQRNIDRALRRETKRPRLKANGEPQSEGNIKYRGVHLALAIAVEQGWQINHYPLCNSSKEGLGQMEAQMILEKKCNLNDLPSWFIEDYDALASEFLARDIEPQE